MYYNKFGDLDNWEFTILLLSEFKRIGINEFTKDKLEKDLYKYKDKDKYRNLFLDIKCTNNSVFLEDALSILMMCGYICIPTLNSKVIHIINIDISLVGKFFDIDKVRVVKSLVKEYYIDRFVKCEHFCFLSNAPYKLLSGFSDGKNIDWSLITDYSTFRIEKILSFKNSISINDPFNSYKVLNIRKGQVAKVSFSGNGNFVLMRKKVNGVVKDVNLYADSSDNSLLKQYFDYSFLENSTNYDIKVLKLSR